MSVKQMYQPLSVTVLRRGRFQPRQQFDEESLQELAASIRDQGLIEPIIVREITNGCYEIIAGERRWRAAQMADLKEVPCLIGDYNDEQAATLTLVENIQREALNLIEEAQGYRRLIDEFHFQQDEIAHLVSKSRSHIANLLRLLSLAPAVQASIQAGTLSLGHARLLVNLPSSTQVALAEQVSTHQWSVRFLEEFVKKKHKHQPDSDNLLQAKGKDIVRLEQELSEQVGAPVKIQSENNQGGWLQIKFYDNETLTGLLERMGLRYDESL